jgi:hypothetical protein
VVLGDGGTNHGAVAAALSAHGDARLVTIEMLPARHEPHWLAVDRAALVACSTYGSHGIPTP